MERLRSFLLGVFLLAGSGVYAGAEDLPTGGGEFSSGMGMESLLSPEDGLGVLPDPSDGGGVSLLTDDPGDGDGAVPVDGGLGLLLAAGAAYGARRLRRHKLMV